MAAAEIENGDVLFHRDAAANTWGVLDVREAFAKENPDLVRLVIASYERVRGEALKDPAALKAALVTATKLPEPVVARQLERTDLSQPAIGPVQAEAIRAAGRFSLLVERTEPTIRYVSVEGPVTRIEQGTDERSREMAARYLPPEKVDGFVEYERTQLGEHVSIFMRPERWLSADLGAL